ncbi:MAG TPA: carbon-nitrogen hydrolase family protein [Dehalococcoidia bacterium]|nr:carbon-nitrogen hydrolase family protein [Dehalococcoidia bacterium]
MSEGTFSIAAVQATPVVLDREATVEKACGLIAEAASRGARLVVFPEAFIPTYPDWVWALAPGEVGKHAGLYAELLEQAVSVPSPATERLCQAARDAGAYVVMGINERNDEASGSSLYCCLLYIDDKGQIMGKHRKLVPTAAERLVWAQGDGSTLEAYDTGLGKLGGLICWENYMPLARYAMYAWGTQIYVAPTWDRGEPWLSTLRHIAKEGGVYVVGVCSTMRQSDLPEGVIGRVRYEGDGEDWINTGESAIVNPRGEVVAGPVSKKEEIIYAEVDPSSLGSRWWLDVAGHYGRPDVFGLTVRRDARPMISDGQVSEAGSALPEEVAAVREELA